MVARGMSAHDAGVAGGIIMNAAPVLRRFLAATVIAAVAAASPASATSVLLYSNDFESPNVPLLVQCGKSLDQRGINFLYGEPGFTYNQEFTVEGITVDDPSNLYSDPQGNGGQYSIGMQTAQQNDRLAVTFDRQALPFINVGMDLSSIDVSGCGGPFGVAVPVMQVSLVDSPGGTFHFAQTVLDTDTMTG
jgi:hypothetical protein